MFFCAFSRSVFCAMGPGPAEAGHYTLSRYQTQTSALVVVSDTGGDRTLDGRRPFRGDAWPQRLVDTEHRAVECLAIRLDPRVALLAGYGLHRRRRCREPRENQVMQVAALHEHRLEPVAGQGAHE